jgi:VIT1/CCC1 family predicted Fe2+/Mn2+ transporter
MDRTDDRSLGELLNDLTRQLSELVRQEIRLARVETTARVGAVARNGALIGVGAALAYAGLFAIGAALILLLIDAGLEPWVAALVVGLAVVVVGALLVMAGRSALRTADLTPRQTIDTLKEDAAWAKDRMP